MSYIPDAPWRVTVYAQQLLGVPADGVWGPRTESAYKNASQSLRARIDEALAKERLSAYSVQRVTTQVRRPGSASTPSATRVKNEEARRATAATLVSSDSGWMTFDQLRPVLLAATQGLEHATYDRMVRKLQLEAGQRRVNGVVQYNTRSVNGSYKGLFQMGAAAWKDIESRLGHKYDMVFDPAINARAAALYIENNVRVARKLGYRGPITDDVVYTMHNQGVGGFLRIVNGGKVQGKQSAAAQQIIAAAAVTGNSV